MAHTEIQTKPYKIETSQLVSVEPEVLDVSESEPPLARAIGKKVCDEVQGLRRVYQERLQGYTTHVGNRIFEDEGFVTRRYAGVDDAEVVAAEEYYLRLTSYDAGRKSEFGPVEQTIVRIVTEAGEQELYVDEGGNARVTYREGSDGEWQVVPYQTAKDWAGELSHRALIAAVRHGERTPEQKAAANAEAKMLLRKRFPMFGMHEASVE